MLYISVVLRHLDRPVMAIVRFEVYLRKPKHGSFWVRLVDIDNTLKGFCQKFEYMGVPKPCKLLGHLILQFEALEIEKC